jgi:DNA-binding PucR family transcriptional regulator
LNALFSISILYNRRTDAEAELQRAMSEAADLPTRDICDLTKGLSEGIRSYQQGIQRFEHAKQEAEQVVEAKGIFA